MGAYDLSVYGPNGFFREYKGGSVVAVSTSIQSSIAYDIVKDGVTLTAVNHGTKSCALQVADNYTGGAVTKDLKAGADFQQFFSVTKFHGWYDFVLTVATDAAFKQQLAGHLETGKDSVTDPHMPVQQA